jgi:hypothetical protein
MLMRGSTMRNLLRRSLGQTRLFQALRKVRQKWIYEQWLAGDRPLPPPHFHKQLTVREYARTFRTPILVETGTYLGDMVDGVKNDFETIYSIELGRELHEAAKRRFRSSGHVQLLQGDSTEVLPRILAQLKAPCLFWLDAHYSAGVTARGTSDTPIVRELEMIFGAGIASNVILIDDARCFTGADDYPALDDLRSFVESRDARCRFEVRDDIIRIHH